MPTRGRSVVEGEGARMGHDGHVADEVAWKLAEGLEWSVLAGRRGLSRHAVIQIPASSRGHGATEIPSVLDLRLSTSHLDQSRDR